MDGKVNIVCAEDLDIRTFAYDVQKQTLTIDLSAGPNAKLILGSTLVPDDPALKNVGDCIAIPLRPMEVFRKTLAFRQPEAE